MINMRTRLTKEVEHQKCTEIRIGKQPEQLAMCMTGHVMNVYNCHLVLRIKNEIVFYPELLVCLLSLEEVVFR